MSQTKVKQIKPLDRKSYTLGEMSDITGLSVSFLRKQGRDGLLRTIRVGKRVLVLSEDLDRYLSGRVA